MRTLLGIVLISLVLPVYGQFEKEQQIETKIEQVKICLRGAELIREKTITLSEGRHKLIFTGLSTTVNPQSIQVTATNDVSVLSVTSQINFLKRKKENPKAQVLKDSLQLLNIEKQNISDQIIAYDLEEGMLKTNQKLSGNQAGLAVAELAKGADFYRKRYKDVYQSRSKLRRAQTKLQQTIRRVQQQANKLTTSRNRNTSEIYLSVKASRATTTTVKVRYVVNDAGWSPIYDLKVVDLDKPINLKYRGLAYNNTGIDWNDVQLVLSTSDPNASASSPTLTPWSLDYYNPQVYAQKEQSIGLNYRSNVIQKNDYKLRDKSLNQVQNSKDQGSNINAGSTNIRFETVEVAELTTDFEIKETYSIPSDRNPYSIDINEFDLAANYKHLTIPKLDRDAFLLGRITGWETLDLIDGPMNIYYGDSYIGLSDLNTNNLRDTLDLSLGRDQKVLVKRTKLKEFSKKQFLGSNQIATYTYKMTVKNNRNQAISIDVEDQVPVSSKKEITVDVKETSNATYYDLSGKLKWTLNLQPGESKTIQFSYSIKYPKNKKIKLEKRKQQVMPRYY